MITIYDIKPKFQRLLRPMVNAIYARGYTANQVTLFTFFFCFLYAIIFSIFITSSFILMLFPIILFLRMALNAIDGLLAREHDQKTPLGAILNELTDMTSDVVLYLPFALYPGIQPWLLVLIVILSLMSEAVGLSGLLVGATRRYDGPMGKSDRAFAFSTLAIWLALFHFSTGVNWILGFIASLIIFTIANRIYQILREARHEHVA